MMPPNSAPTRRSATPTSAAERPGHPGRPASGQPGGIGPSGPDLSGTSRHRTSPVPGWNLRLSAFSMARRAARDRGIPCAWTHAERRQDGDAQKIGRHPHPYETPRSRTPEQHRSRRSVLRPQPRTRTLRCCGPRTAVLTACCRASRRQTARTAGARGKVPRDGIRRASAGKMPAARCADPYRLWVDTGRTRLHVAGGLPCKPSGLPGGNSPTVRPEITPTGYDAGNDPEDTIPRRSRSRTSTCGSRTQATPRRPRQRGRRPSLAGSRQRSPRSP